MSKIYKSIIVEKKDKIFKITLNRPKKNNAVNDDLFLETIEALKEAAEDKDCLLTVFTGNGEYYCSGADLSDFELNEEYFTYIDKRTRKYVAAFIDHPKPLVALVNGPAIGIGVTVLGLFDLVYASEKATFMTPFTTLGAAPEGCSSYLFPKIMGTSNAASMLLFGQTLNAKDACRQGLVTEVFPKETFISETTNRIKRFANLPRESVLMSRKLIRETEKDLLHKVNNAECDVLDVRWRSEETMEALMNFYSKKPMSKL